MANKDEIRYTISVDTESGTASVRNLKGQIVATQVPVKQLRTEFGNFAKTVNASNFNKFNSELKKTNSSISNLKSGLSGASAASGSASASVLEVGRAISDSNYGIQGMANNLSQLASNLVYTTKTAGGLSKGLKALGKAFLGPLGIIVVIQTVIMLFERMSMQSSKAESELDKLSKATAKGASNLVILKKAIDEGTISKEELSRSLKKANSEYEGLNLKVDKNNKLTQDSVTAIDNKIAAMKRLSKAVALQSLIEEQYAKLLPLQAKEEELTTKALESEERAVRALSQSYRENGTASVQASAERARAAVDANKKSQKEINAEINRLVALANKEDLFDEMFKPKKSGGGGRDRADKVFKEQILNLEKFILQKQRDTEKSKERNVMNLLEIDQRYAREDLKLTYDTFVEKQKLRFKQYTESEAKRKNLTVEQFKNTKQYAAEEAKLNKSLSDAQTELDTASDNQKLAQEAAYQRKRLEVTEKFNDLILKANLKSSQADAKARLGRYDGTNAGSLNNPQSAVGADGVDAQIAIRESLMAEEQENFEETLAIKLQNLENQGFLLAEREAIIAEDRFQFQTDMATRELELEQMKIDAKRSINEEYISWVGGLGSVLSDLAGENEALAKVALILEKGSAIADIIVKTQSANAKVTLAASEEAAGYNASAGLYSANPAAAAGYLALAKAATIRGKTRVVKNNIGAGISIAKIASTTLQSRSQGGGGGSSSGGGGGGRTFDFNLVGSTGENQLAQGIAGQLGSPVQAYVVSSQMTSQQQLDNAIQTSATLGD